MFSFNRDEDNLGSVRTIQGCGGVLDSIVEQPDGQPMKRRTGFSDAMAYESHTSPRITTGQVNGNALHHGPSRVPGNHRPSQYSDWPLRAQIGRYVSLSVELEAGDE